MYLLSFSWVWVFFFFFLLHLIKAFDDGKIIGREIMHESAWKDCMKWLLWGAANQASKQSTIIV